MSEVRSATAAQVDDCGSVISGARRTWLSCFGAFLLISLLSGTLILDGQSALRVQCTGSGVGQYSGVLVSPLFHVLLIRCESGPQVSFNAIFVVCIFITSVLQSLDSSQPLDPGSTSQTSKTQLSGLSLVYRILSKKLSGVRSRDAENLDPLPVHQSNDHSRQCGY